MSLLTYDVNYFKRDVTNFMDKMRLKYDYLMDSSNQPAVPSTKTPGSKLFTPDVFKSNKNKLDLTIFPKVLTSNLVTEQEKKFYLLQQFMLELADRDYKEVSNITERLTQNIEHIKELMANLQNGKPNKLIYLVPKDKKEKSNFWLSLYFIELARPHLNPDYMIDIIERVNINQIVNFPNYNNYNYVVVVTDDISYSGSQLSEDNLKLKLYEPKIASSVTVFLNLIGYSEVAKKRIEKDKIDSGNNQCKIVFGRGAKHPLTKLSAKFNDVNLNNVLVAKSNIDFGSLALSRVNVKMMASLILNDVFYFYTTTPTHGFSSKLFKTYTFYETYKKHENNNGSIQYISIKYPDGYSTVENMCKFKKIQNMAIFRIDKLIHYLNLPNMSDNEKLYWLAEKIIDGNLWNDTSDMVTIKIELLNQILFSKTFPVIPNSFDEKFIEIFEEVENKIPKKKIGENTNIKKITNFFTGSYNDTNYNNLVMTKFCNLNNKISKFNKKHLLEFTMPKNQYQTNKTTRTLIKNCNKNKNNLCNQDCALNFYKKIKWD